MSKQLSIIEYIGNVKYEKEKNAELQKFAYFLHREENRRRIEADRKRQLENEKYLMQEKWGSDNPYEEFHIEGRCQNCKTGLIIYTIGKISEDTIGIGAYDEPSYLYDYTYTQYHCPICGVPQRISHPSLDSLKIISITVKQ